MNPARRTFLKTGAATAASLGFSSVARAQDAPATKTFKIGLVGCGGRGSGAADNALKADNNTRLWAVADVFENRVAHALNKLGKRHGDRAAVPAERQFVGLDAYEKVIEQCDIVLLCAPPGFRPRHIAATVAAGKPLFAEKPMAVDMAGVHSVVASAKLAAEKGVSFQHGYCWRFDPGLRDAYGRVHAGEIGDIRSLYGTYLFNPVKPMQATELRKPGTSDVEWQIANWMNFSWLSGGTLVEQAIHSLDKISWALQDATPIAAYASGGRVRPDDGGNIFDHFNVTYEFPGGVLAHLAQRQWPNSFKHVNDRVEGTQGTLFGPERPAITGAGKRWRYRAPAGEAPSMYQITHDEFFASLRKGEVLTPGPHAGQLTALALLGREAGWSGQRITWEELWNSQKSLAPIESLKWSDSFDPGPRPVPGQYRFS